MRIATSAILGLAVLNPIAFAVLAIFGVIRGVNYPFPSWFRNEKDICLYLALVLCFASLVCFAWTQQKVRAALALGLSFSTVLAIAFLTSRG